MMKNWQSKMLQCLLVTQLSLDSVFFCCLHNPHEIAVVISSAGIEHHLSNER